ncbi:unnamed protein product, partial [Gongylonema pulchrum]|uniref:Uncharacterized protein n=1 Tax=Gongylonema pulchrum TaxID=637853 RepID=A0A183DQI9_9BILA
MSVRREERNGGVHRHITAIILVYMSAVDIESRHWLNLYMQSSGLEWEKEKGGGQGLTANYHRTTGGT